MIGRGKSQNQSRNDRENKSFRGGRGVYHGGGRYLPRQASGPTIPYHGGGRYLPRLPRQASGPTIPIVASLHWHCEICDVKLSSSHPKHIEQHKNGKKHRSLLNLKPHEKLQSQKAINGQEVVQPEKVQKSEKNVCLVENVSSEATIDQYLQKDVGESSEVPVEKPMGEPRHNSASQGYGFKRKISGARGGKYIKRGNGIRRPLESSKPDINALSNFVVSQVQVPVVQPPPGPVASQIPSSPPGSMASRMMATAPVVGSSLELQFSEAKANHEIQNPTGESNNQPGSISGDLHALAGSSINSQTEDLTSDSAAVVIAPPPGPVASQLFEPTAAVGSSIELQIPHVLRTQLPEIIAHNESQNCTEETNIQLPSSVIVESDASAGSTDGSSKAEENIDVLNTKEPVCLKCGDQGFPETLVFCSKCQVYALHRYCLDGPVIFVDDVTWFCEDCKAQAVDTSSHDPSTPLQPRTSDSANLAKDAIQDRTDLITNCMERVKINKQLQQKVGKKLKKRKVMSSSVAKTKVQLSDSHSSLQHEPTQCGNNCEEGNKFNEESQPVSRDAAASSSESTTVQISPVATNDDLGSAELAGHADAQPIADPIWRGSLYFCNESIDTVGVLLAHLSSLACSMVLEEIKFFPEVLGVDLLQTSEVWPKGFQEHGPSDQSIALYFFPENERAEKAFDKLVDDIVHHDLAMKAVVENAELLIFPSTLLPIHHRRFQAKYYLWGVFIAKQTSPMTDDAVCGGQALNPA